MTERIEAIFVGALIVYALVQPAWQWLLA